MRFSYLIAILLFTHTSWGQIDLHYVAGLNDVLDTGAVFVRSTEQRYILMGKAKEWLAKESGRTWRDTILNGSPALIGRPVLKLFDWVIASIQLVEKRTLEFNQSIWFEGDSLKCAMSGFIYCHKKGNGLRSVPLSDWYREHHRKNASRMARGKEPKPKHDEIVDMDRSLSHLVNRLAYALAD